MEDLIDEIIFPEARGRRATVTIEALRGLREEDLSALRDTSLPVAPSRLSKIRHSHHQLARLVATGMSYVEVSAVTGYTTVYISRLCREDPAFQELLQYYGQQREMVFVDTLERMKNLGISALEELQERLAEDPEGWSKRELMEMSRMMLLEGRQAGGGLQAPAPSVSVQVQFVEARPKGPVIDA